MSILELIGLKETVRRKEIKVKNRQVDGVVIFKPLFFNVKFI